MNCFLYCRKSTEDKARQVQSIDDQKKVLKEIARVRNLKVTEIFIDEKSAGKPYQRVGFQEMMKRIHQGEVQIVLCWKIDRLSRNPIDNGQLSWMLQQGIIKEIITADRTYLPEDNVLLFMVEGAMANQYLRDLSANVKRGMQSRVEKGVYPGYAPLGYLNAGTLKGHKRIIPDPDYFPVIKKLWKIFGTRNYQLADLYRIMQEKYPIYKNGKLLAFSSFYRIFNNPFYCGIFQWAGKQHLGTHKLMLSQSEFEAIHIRSVKKHKTREKNLEFDFKGIMKCGNCGACITAERKTKFIKSENRYRTFDYYRCTRRKRDVRCLEKPLSKKQIETQLLGEIESVYLPKEVIEYGKERFHESRHELMNIEKGRLTILEKEIRECHQCLDKVEGNLAFESDSEIREIMKGKHAEIKIKAKKLREDLEALGKKSKTVGQEIIESLEILENGKALLVEGEREQKRRLFHNLGLDWRMESRKLVYEPHFLVHAIQKTKKRYQDKFGGLEPEKSRSVSEQRLTHAEVVFIWSTLWELIRNSKISRKNRKDI